MAERLRAVREQGGEGLIAELVQVEKEGGRISHDELLSMLFLLLNAGSITTTHLISGAVFELLKDPARRDWLMADWSRAGSCGRGIPALRLAGAILQAALCARGCRARRCSPEEGRQVMAMIVAANLDPQANPHPEKLDLARQAEPAYCPSAPASIFASAISSRGSRRWRALQALFTRWPKLEARGRALGNPLAPASGAALDRRCCRLTV